MLLSIECWLENKSEILKETILRNVEYCSVEDYDIHELGDILYFEKVREKLITIFKERYFNSFLKSKYMIILKKIAYRHELYQVKINNSSLVVSGEKINFMNHDWPLEQLE